MSCCVMSCYAKTLLCCACLMQDIHVCPGHCDLAFNSMVHVIFMPSGGFFGFSGAALGGLALFEDLNERLTSRLY